MLHNTLMYTNAATCGAVLSVSRHGRTRPARMAAMIRKDITPSIMLGLKGRSMNALVRCVVVGVTERDGQAWDLVCVADGLGRFEVDPFVGCALPELSDSERRALVGQSFDMGDYWQHKSGVYLCRRFTPNKEISTNSSVGHNNG